MHRVPIAFVEYEVEGDEVEKPPVAVDELFVDFFYNFAGDARFQNQRIVFPLLCKEGEGETKLTKHEWNEWNQFGEQEFYAVIYEREQDLELQNDTTIQSVDVEWIHLKEEKQEKYGFDRVNGKWMLTEMQTEKSSETPNGDFLQFYSQFVADSVFQREALAVPVRLILTSADEEEDVQEETLSADLLSINQSIKTLRHELKVCERIEASIPATRISRFAARWFCLTAPAAPSGCW
mgnify:CR=1 FL=1